MKFICYTILVVQICLISVYAQSSEMLFHCNYDEGAIDQAVNPVYAKGHPEVITFSGCSLVQGKQGNAI